MMKTLVAAVSCAAILAGSATVAVTADDVSEEMRSVESFDRIRNKGSFEVYVNVGSEQSVKVTADSEIIGEIETEVRGSTLHIRMDDDFEWRRYRNIEKLRVDITVPSLESVRVDGSGDFEVHGIDAETFSANVNGSGDIELISAKTQRLNIDVKGSGDVEASGTCTDIDVEVKGSGDVEARDMACASGDIGIMGSGDVSVTLNESVDVGIMGSGDVVVYGKPDKVSTRAMGSGDVVLR